MFSQFFACVWPQSVISRRFAQVAHHTALGAITASLVIGFLPNITAQAADVTRTSTKTALLNAFPRQPIQALGTPVTTNLAAYRDYCSNPKEISQITALCISLGVLTGQNPDGSVEFENLTEGLPPGTEPVRPEEATSTPKPYPLGAITPEQSDKVQLFASP